MSDKKQSLAIALSIARRPKKKKMAEGGAVNESAKTEQRPSASGTNNNSKQVSNNRGNKAPGQDSVLDQPTVAQARKPSKTPLSHPKMAPITGPFSVRSRDMHADAIDAINRMRPDNYGDQPPARYDELDAQKQGSDPDMKDSHSTGRKPYQNSARQPESRYPIDPLHSKPENPKRKYAEGGEVEEPEAAKANKSKGDKASTEAETSTDSNTRTATSTKAFTKGNITVTGGAGRGANTTVNLNRKEDESDDDMQKMAQGGKVTGQGAMSDSDRESLSDDGDRRRQLIGPGAMSDSERKSLSDMDDDRQLTGPGAMSDSDGRQRYGQGGIIDIIPDTGFGKIIVMKAEGGEVESSSEDDEIGKAASVAEAIMARRRMAHGGAINGMDSIDSDSYTDEADLSRNAEEDANMADQASYKALRKENYSQSEGLAQLDSPEDSNTQGHEIDSDKHGESLVSAIRARMKRKSPITR